jgi:hypothetical protein
MSQRVLVVVREIGRHPRAGLWLIAQLLIVLLVAGLGHRGATAFLPLAFVPPLMLLQFPASLLVASATSWMFGVSHDRLELPLLAILKCQWVAAAFLNYVLWVYGLPRLSRWIDARWPFEQKYFRR